MKMDQGLWLLRKIKEEKRQRREEQRKELLQQASLKLESYFRQKGVTEAYFFGSLTREDMFYEWSDVDIVVSHEEGHYFHMLSELERLLKRDVHLIELKRCPFAERVRHEGIRII